MLGDEIRYINFADHLIHGFYSTPAPFINLWNGPGYPIILMPFAWLHISPLYQALMNAPCLYLAVVFLYKALHVVSNRKIALVLSLLMAVYPNALAMLPLVYTETFTCLLVALFIYTVSLYYVKPQSRYGIIAGILLGYLVLTKIIFGYVVVLCAAAFLPAFMFKKHTAHHVKAVKVLLIAFLITLPYLFYTWRITGKFFYWGNSGGMSLYWMSTPYEEEYGDWKIPNLSNTQYPRMFKSAEAVAILKKNHAKEIAYIEKHTNKIEQDELYKQMAIRNIKEHPAKFIRNYINNFSRMLFNFPYSYSFQDAGIGRSIIIGSSVLWATVLALILTFANWRKIGFVFKFVLLITGVYLLLTGMLSAYPRQLDVIMPVLLFWFGYLAQHIKKIRMRFEDEDPEQVSLTELAGPTAADSKI